MIAACCSSLRSRPHTHCPLSHFAQSFAFSVPSSSRGRRCTRGLKHGRYVARFETPSMPHPHRRRSSLQIVLERSIRLLQPLFPRALSLQAALVSVLVGVSFLGGLSEPPAGLWGECRDTEGASCFRMCNVQQDPKPCQAVTIPPPRRPVAAAPVAQCTSHRLLPRPQLPSRAPHAWQRGHRRRPILVSSPCLCRT